MLCFVYLQPKVATTYEVRKPGMQRRYTGRPSKPPEACEAVNFPLPYPPYGLMIDIDADTWHL